MNRFEVSHGRNAGWMILWSLLALGAESAHADAPIAARVLAVESGIVTLAAEEAQNGEFRRWEIQLRNMEMLQKMVPGVAVRLWLTPDGHASGVSLAPIDASARENDLTGVRSRLSRSAGGTANGHGGGGGSDCHA